MSAVPGLTRFAPTAVLGAVATVVTGFAINGLSPDPWKWSWWWLSLVLGAVGLVASTLWAFRLQSKQSDDRPDIAQRSAVGDQQLAAGNKVNMNAAPGGITALNISGGITMSPQRGDDDPHPRRAAR